MRTFKKYDRETVAHLLDMYANAEAVTELLKKKGSTLSLCVTSEDGTDFESVDMGIVAGRTALESVKKIIEQGLDNFEIKVG